MTRPTHVKLGPMADIRGSKATHLKWPKNIPCWGANGARKWAKRMRRRARRRLEKRDPEGARAMEGKYDGWLS